MRWSFFTSKKSFESKGTLFTQKEWESLERGKIPSHIAIIPDGNRRWAKKHCFSHARGHTQGADAIIETVKAALEIGVKVVTFYLFSTENWKRPEKEIEAHMALLKQSLLNKREEMLERGISFKTIGDLKPIPEDVLKVVEEIKRETAACQSIDLVFALNYGGRDELVRAVSKIVKEGGSIEESHISESLDTYPWKDPDLLIRTSGERRLSNFLLWQLSYAELYFTDILWPDFKPKDLYEAIRDYQGRERRLGGQ